MSVTKRDMQCLAEKLKRVKNIMDRKSWCMGVAFIMAGLHELNGNFKPKLFLKACDATEKEDVDYIVAMYELTK